VLFQRSEAGRRLERSCCGLPLRLVCSDESALDEDAAGSHRATGGWRSRLLSIGGDVIEEQHMTLSSSSGTTCDGSGKACGCGGVALPPSTLGSIRALWADGVVHTPMGDVPRVKTLLSGRDHLGMLRARWGVGRMGYRVPPGLYAVGDAGAESPVLVSANYKMSFDRLRAVLTGRQAWILVLNTQGINVWCAAGKGTFGTDEIVRRVGSSGLDQIVSHRRLVLPQLGAPGVSAHEVHARCGFRVEYGPVRADDLPSFLDNSMTATPEMRHVHFGLRDRLVLTPVELVMGAGKALLVAAALVLLGGLGPSGYSLAGVRSSGLTGALWVLGAFVGAAVLGPVLLPWLPGRAFSLKGGFLGVAMVVAVAILRWSVPEDLGTCFHMAAWTLIVPALASFVVMNFTGASTFTSLSGVLREMRFALPVQATSAVLGLGLWIAGLFLAGGH
jgi:hypothetical protein